MSDVKISRGGMVTDRKTGRDLGHVLREEWISEVDDPDGGRMIKIEYGWEARRPHEFFIVGQTMPWFRTRREAVAHLVAI